MDHQGQAILAAAGVPVAVRIRDDAIRLASGEQIEGMPASRWLRTDPAYAPEVALGLGTLLRTLRAVPWGTAEGWPARWAGRVRAQRTACRRERLDLGPPLDALLASAEWLPEDRLPELVPMHGSLSLDQVWLDRSLRPITLLGIEAATPGDALVDAMTALRFRDPALRRLALEAAGVRDGPGVLERMSAYLRGDLLAQLLTAPSEPQARATLQEQVRLRLEDAHDPLRALTAPRLAPDRPVIATRMALERAAEPILNGPAWVGALGASLLAVGLPDALAGRFGLVAIELAGAPEIPSPGPPSEAAVDLARRAMVLVDGAVGAHVHAGMRPPALPRPVDRALGRALTQARASEPAGPERPEGLPLELLQRVADDPLAGDRASLPGLAWAAQVLARRGARSEGIALLEGALGG